MTSDKGEMEKYRYLASKFMTLNGGLDKAIKARCVGGKENPSPFLHCEILLFDAFWRCQGPEDRRFFNKWKCIGVSKPPCLLCHYFFLEHVSGVKLRMTHGNFYLRWRFPYPIARNDSADALKEACHKMVDGVRGRVRDQIFRTLETGEITGGAHDSNTATTPYNMRRDVSVAGTKSSGLSTAWSSSSPSEGAEDWEADDVYGDEDVEAWAADTAEFDPKAVHEVGDDETEHEVESAAGRESVDSDDDDDEGGGVILTP
jgi:hypothetical protein